MHSLLSLSCPILHEKTRNRDTVVLAPSEIEDHVSETPSATTRKLGPRFRDDQTDPSLHFLSKSERQAQKSGRLKRLLLP